VGEKELIEGGQDQDQKAVGSCKTFDFCKGNSKLRNDISIGYCFATKISLSFLNLCPTNKLFELFYDQ